MRTSRHTTHRWLLLTWCLLVVSGCGRSEAPEASPTTRQAPSSHFTDVNGQPHTLEEWRGRLVLLNFWATWCPPCRDEIPDLVDLYEAFKARGVVVIGVSLDVGGRRAVQPFIERYDVTYPIWLGTYEAARRFRVVGIPTSFLLDRDGAILERFDGPYSKEDFVQALRPYLEEP